MGPVKCLEIFRFDDTLWPGTIETIDRLKEAGLTVEIVSGDAYQSVERVASRLGVGQFPAAARPDDKISRLAEQGCKTLFVSYGLNDGLAFRVANVLIALSSAVDIGRNAEDFVFLHAVLRAVVTARVVSRNAVRMTRQNLAFA